MIEEHASAKINLALHVTGQRADGYHLLDTLVTFARAGDRVTVDYSDIDRFTISGRFAAGLPAEASPNSGNLVLRARDLLRLQTGQGGPVAITLEKNLPIASGIGGGSADAAATLRALSRLWQVNIPREDLAALALSLGADVPMCLESKSLLARGIGEDIRLLPHFPSLHLLLVNPMVEVSTPAIFKALTEKNNPPLALPPGDAGWPDWLAALKVARNDLQPPAETLRPEITEALDLLRTTGPLLVRMSGSGATCFGVYGSSEAAAVARCSLETLRPGWYLQDSATV